MPTVVEHTSGPRNRWLLPALLALLVAAIVLGAIFLPKVIKSAASPTATPKVVVATAQPTVGGVTAVVSATAGGAPTAAGTGSTPLPGASPIPSQSGLTLGMITHPAHDVTQAQAGVDRKDPAYTWYLDPRQVVQHQLPSYGFHNFQIVSPGPSPTPTPHPGALNRPVVKFIVSYNGQNYTVAVTQPDRQGPTGVWFVVTILRGQHLP